MSKLTQEQKDAFTNINAMLSLDADLFKGNVNMSFSTNPLDYILGLLLAFVPYNKILDIISDILIYGLAPIELSIKTLLLAQLKRNIDCSNDPRIPDYLRKEKYSPLSNGTDDFINRKGIYINTQAIDLLGMLNISPLSKEGSLFYFGTSSKFVINDEKYEDEIFTTYNEAVSFCKEKGLNISSIIDKSEVKSVYELARANDFNAFLWFVIHKSHFYDSKVIKGSLKNHVDVTKYYDSNGKPFELRNQYFTVNNNLGAFEGRCRLTTNNSVKPFFVGDTLVQKINAFDTNATNVISLCIKSEQMISNNTTNTSSIMNDDDKELISLAYSPRDYKFSFVPVSSDYKSANWYINNGTMFNYLLPQNKKKPRDYSKEYAICNIQYLDKAVSNIGNGDILRNVMLFSILPKPFIYLSSFVWNSRRVLFNDKGVPTSKGKYSVEVVNSNPTPIKIDGKHVEDEYTLTKLNSQTKSESNVKLRVNYRTGEYYLYILIDGNMVTSGDEFEVEIGSVLYECYPGFTVYEFNYDYVMNMQLFDPKTLISQLLLSVANVEFGVNVSKTTTAYQMRIAKIVENVIEQESVDSSFSFSNKEYDELLNEAELKRSKMYPFANSTNSGGEVDREALLKTLSQISNEESAEENVTVFKSSIKQVTGSLVSDEVLPESEYNYEITMLKQIVNNLVTTIIMRTLLTPKILTLLIVNRQLMGYDTLVVRKEDLENMVDALLDSLLGMIMSLVLEIKDLIVRKLLDFLMGLLKDLSANMLKLLAKEQVEYYTKLIKMLVENCTFNFNRNYIDGGLDQVYYADIIYEDKEKLNKE